MGRLGNGRECVYLGSGLTGLPPPNARASTRSAPRGGADSLPACHSTAAIRSVPGVRSRRNGAVGALPAGDEPAYMTSSTDSR